MKNILTLFIAFMITINFINAQEYEHSNTHSKHQAHIHHNHLAIFSGATSNLEHKSTDFSLGIDYEHRFSFSNGLLGIGLFGEAVFTEHTEILAGVPIFIHPISSLKFLFAPSIISYEEEENKEESHSLNKIKYDQLQADESGNTTKHNDFLIRIGLAYDFHFGNFSFSPNFNADFHSGNVAIVYGLSIGYGF